MGLFALATLLAYGPGFDVMAWLIRRLPRTDARIRALQPRQRRDGGGPHAAGHLLRRHHPAAHHLPPLEARVRRVEHRRGLRRQHRGRASRRCSRRSMPGCRSSASRACSSPAPRSTCASGSLLWPRLPARAGVGRGGGPLRPSSSISTPTRWPPASTATATLIGADEQLVFHADGKTASVDVTGNPNGQLVIKTNGKTDATMTVDQGEPLLQRRGDHDAPRGVADERCLRRPGTSP